MNSVAVRLADWHKDNAALHHIRSMVFCAEQHMPPELEFDAEDASAVHFLALEGDYPVGTARLLADGTIGRVSVLRDWRGLHVGNALMQAAIAQAERQGLHEQRLSAQVHAAPFYARLGFNVVSEEFLEAGIPHVEMIRCSGDTSPRRRG